MKCVNTIFALYFSQQQQAAEFYYPFFFRLCVCLCAGWSSDKLAGEASYVSCKCDYSLTNYDGTANTQPAC